MSPRSKEQNEIIREQSKAAIKEAALELFAMHGFASTSISRIAKEAGVSKGLMYNYYESKDALLHAIVEDTMQDMMAEMGQFLSPELSPDQRLRGIVEGTLNMVERNLHHWKLLMALTMQPGLFKNMESVFSVQKDESIQALISLYKELDVAHPEEEAFLFGAALDGMVLHFTLMGENYPLAKMKAFFLERFCNH
jgi:AcrR family transcriptional regulator